MSGPRVFNLDTEEEIPLQQKKSRVFDLDKEEEIEPVEQSPIDKIGSTISGGVKSGIENTVLAAYAFADITDKHGGRTALINKVKDRWNNAVQAAPIFGHDLLNFFDTFSKKQLDKVINDASLAINEDTSVTEILAKPFKLTGKALSPFAKFETYPNIAAGVVEMLVRPAELLLGQEFSQDARPSTPEETAIRAKHLLGDAVMVLATHDVAGAIARGLAGEAASKGGKAIAKGATEELTTKELIDAAAGPKMGAIGRRVISNTVGGAVGGFAQGLVANSGNDDSLEKALMAGVMGVPLGFAQEFAIGAVKSLRGKVLETPEEVAEIAKSIADERQVKLYANDSIESVINKLDALKDADNLSEAARKLGEVKQPEFFGESVLEQFKQNFYDEFNFYAYKTSNILEAEPVDGFNFDVGLRNFMKEKGIPEDFIPAIREDVVKRLREEFVNDLEPDERFALNRITNDLELARDKMADDYLTVAHRVNRKAAEQGMYIDKEEGGVLVLKSRETGERILDMRDSKVLMDEFARDAGRPRELENNLVMDSGIPSEAIPISPPPRPPTISGNLGAAFSPLYTRFGNFWDIVKISRFGSALTTVKDVMGSLDNIHGTEFTKKIYDTTQPAYRRTVAKLIPYHKELNDISNMGRGLSSEQWRQISQYREARTAKELVDRFTKTRGVSPLEQSHGQWLADTDIDINRVFAYGRAIEQMEESGLDAASLEVRKRELEVDLGMDSKHLEAYGRFQTVLSGSRNNSDLGAVIAYARALKSGISKADFAARNNMTSTQLRIARRLDDYYNKIADDFGIEDGRRLEDYMNHYRRYGEFPKFSELSDRTEEFLSEMPRTGEIAEYEDHPIVAAMRYTTAGVKVKEFYPIWNKAKVEMEGELRKIDNLASKDLAKMQITNYLEGIIGNRQFISDATLNHMVKAFQRSGINMSDEAIKQAARRWTSNYFAFTEASAQGMRPSQGFRDFYSTVNNHYIRFGAKRSARAMKLFNEMTPEQIKELEMRGEIGTLQPYEVVIPGEAVAEWRGQLARGTERLLDWSFKTSLQKTAYRNGHAMVYNEAKINTLENLNKVADGSLTKEQGYKNLSLHTYDPGIQVQFDRLVSEGKTIEASEFLARLTAAETVFVYGAANQARLMTSLPGALLGQFGVWSTWESRFVTRMMSRGPNKERMKAGMRYAMSQSALAVADGLTGFNLSGWFLTPAAALMKVGPVGQAVVSTADLFNPNQRVSDMAADDLEKKGTLLLPMYQFGKGVKDAYSLWERGFDPATIGMRVGGFGVDEINQNWWDLVLREGLGFEQGRETIPNQMMGVETVKKPSNAGRKATNQQ